MKRRATFYRYRDGAEIDEDEAFENGILKDGIVASIPKMMRDSLTPLQRSVAPNADCRVANALGDPAGRRPGFAIAMRDQAAQDAKAMAYAAYDRERENAWRSPRQNSGLIFPEDQRGYTISRDGPLVGDNGPRPRIECRYVAVNAKDAIRDHSRVMQPVYAAYDHELAQKWRHM
jgi:hypothetical protein